MKKAIIPRPKFQVKWKSKDNKGVYETFIFVQTRKKAEKLLRVAVKNGAFAGQIIEYNKSKVNLID